MEMMHLMKLASSFSNLKLSSSLEDFKPVFEFLGVDEHTGKNVLSVMQLHGASDDQLFSEFLKDGGLIRSLASPTKRIEREYTPVQCPHCKEVIIL